MQGAVLVVVHELGIGTLEQELRPVALRDIGFRHIGEGPPSPGIIFGVETVQAMLVLDLGDKAGIGPDRQVLLPLGRIVGFEFFSAQEGISLRDGIIPLHGGEKCPGLAVKAFLVKRHRAVVFRGFHLGDGRARSE